ncbi:MAG: hypothetical protein ABEJ31_04200 [Haloarculaceae archaeon]
MRLPDDLDLNDLDLEVPRWQLALYGVAAVVIVVLALPTVQGGLYDLLVGTPSFLQWGAVALVVAVIGYYRQSRPLYALAVVIFVVMGLFVGPFVGSVYAHDHVAEQMQSETTQLETLPNTSAASPRLLPRSVADNFAQSSMQYPQYRLTSSDITYRNGSYDWSYGVVPDSPLVALLGTQNGAMYVNMTTTKKDVSVRDTTFKHGRGQAVFDSLSYQSVLHAPLRRHDWETTFNAEHDGTAYVAHSTTTYEWHFQLLPIPQLYAVPTFGSVEIMYPDGHIESLTPEQAARSPLLSGQNVYPYSLAMYRVQSMQYVHGALNKWFWKEDVLQVADLPEGGNEWPLVVPTTGTAHNLTYFVATEPTGSGSGIYQIWTFDGQTGAAGVQEYSDAQIGPRKAVDFVGRDPRVNRLSSAQAISPIPIVKGDTLYWHVAVVPQSRSGVTYTGFVNAQSGDVTLLQGDPQVYAFMTQSEYRRVENGTGSQGGGATTTVTVIVTDADGTVVETRNLTVPAGGDVQIGVHNRAGNASTSRAGS